MTKDMTEGQRAYEAKRAAKAGMSLDKWLAAKEKELAKCPACGLMRHDIDAVHCKACGQILNIPDEGL